MADLEYGVESGVATVLLNRPERKNAFTLEMIDDWVDCLLGAQEDPAVRCVVVRGAGGAFCSGVDLSRVESEMGESPLEIKELLRTRVQRVPLVLRSLDKPVIASISGPAVGAGLDMSLACDVRLASTSAVLRESYVKMGFIPGAGGLWFLPRLVGMANAFEVVMTADAYSADEALRLGIVNRVYDDDVLEKETYRLASQFAAVDPSLAAMIKRTMQQAVTMDLPTHLDLVSSHMAVIRSTAAARSSFSTLRDRVVGPADAETSGT